MAERALLIVHGEALKRWSRSRMNCAPLARELDEKIESESGNYQEVIAFEKDPWEPEWKSNPSYTWDDEAKKLKEKDLDAAGVQENMCVAKVVEELSKRGVHVKVRRDLTMND